MPSWKDQLYQFGHPVKDAFAKHLADAMGEFVIYDDLIDRSGLLLTEEDLLPLPEPPAKT